MDFFKFPEAGLSANRGRRQFRWREAIIGTIATMALVAPVAMAQDLSAIKGYTRATFDQWLAKNKNAKPDFKPGDVLTASHDMAKLVPFIPPGYIELCNFPEFKAPVIATRSHRPRQDYMNCTEKYQSQVKLKPDGSMANYVCGQAFPDSAMKENDPVSGEKASWNFDYRWQNYGLANYDVGWIWDRFGGTHVAPVLTDPPPSWVPSVAVARAAIPRDTSPLYQGGGTFQRALQGPYQRVFYSHLAQLADKGYTLPVTDAKDFEFKEFTGFHEPFDIRGTAFIIYRYENPHRSDDSWAYIPNLRRVRRISVEVKSDSLLGTDHTLEDFYGFSGRPLEWSWKFLGWKDVLVVQDSKWDDSHFYGPNGIVPDDVWSVRRMAVVERKPKSPRNPYSSVVDFFDAENWHTFYMFAWDKKGKLWKVWEFQKAWTEDFKNPARQAINKGVDTTNFQSVQVIDLQNGRGTLVPCFGGGYPKITGSEAESLYDISKLEQIHR